MPARAPRAGRLRRPRGVVPVLLAVAASGCATLAPGRYVESRARPPEEVARAAAAEPPAPAPAAPPDAAPPEPAEPRSLPDLLDLALRRDPATRAAWLEARAAFAAAGAQRSLYLPSLSAGVELERRHTPGGGARAGSTETTWGPSVALSWLLLDLGGRSARVEQADRLAAAAALGERAAVADLVLRVQQTYYRYLASRALVASDGATLEQAQANLAAAEERRRAGVATVADVLQARTAASQARLALQQEEGQALSLRGALATLAGLSPVTPLEVGALPADVRPAETAPAVEALLADAARRNPDLARARALADAAGAAARATSRAWLPAVSLDAGANRTFYLDPSDPDAQTAWSAGLTFRFPLLEGLAPAYETLGARAQAEAARARADAARQQVALDVWTSYQGLLTAGRRIETARDLLASATASTEVARGRYREGVGSILDLLGAQSALASARAEDVRARADYLLALAELARATGRLGLASPGEPAPPQDTPAP